MAFLMDNAKEVVADMGSVAHYALFCRAQTRFIVLVREIDWVVIAQCLIHQAFELDFYLINAAQNYLPSFCNDAGIGVVNFIFTDDFRDFARDYFGRDLSANFTHENDILAYLKAWTKFYSNEEHFKTIKNLNAFDFVNKLSEVLFHKTLDKNFFVKNETSEIQNLKAQILRLKKQSFKHKILYNLCLKPLKYANKKLIFNLLIKPIKWLKFKI